MQKPLAEILRPKTLDSYVGQEHLMSKGAVLRMAIEEGNIRSMILWGPPGVGKTTLALLIAEVTGADFHMLSAISSGVKDIREIFEKAKQSPNGAILFIDEIHRFSKTQQDSLLGAVERGLVTLIGATTENPSFEVISPLLSRCQVYVLKNLSRKNLETILQTAVIYLEKQLQCTINVAESEALLRISGGDARKLLNAIELTTYMARPVNGRITITNTLVLQVIQQNLALYDKKGEQHYDIISAFIKSMRGSDPNAAVYWLARMLAGGEDPLFIARRMVILASEDIGNANPNALLLANNCFQAVNEIGMPEARIPLAQTAIYLAGSPKSNASYMAIDSAMAFVRKTGDLPVPLSLRNAPTPLMKELGYHEDYHYAHDYDNNFIDEEFMPDGGRGIKFYEPQDNPRENELRHRLRSCWKDKYKYVWLLLLALCGCLRSAIAQDYHFSQYYAAPITINPSLAGAYDGIFRAACIQRTQWHSVTKPFLSVAGSLDAVVYKNNYRRELLALGITIGSDKAGDSRYSSTRALLSASYIKNISRNGRHKIGLGLCAGLIYNTINYQALHWDEQYQNGIFDPKIPNSETFANTRQLFFDWGAGAFWSYTPNRTNTFRFGIGAMHLNRPSEKFGTIATRLPVRLSAHFFSRIRLVENLNLQPCFFISRQNKYSEYVFGSNVEYAKKKNSYTTLFSFGAGLHYRWNDAIIVNGFFDWKNLRLGVAYDINVSKFYVATRNRGAIEVSLTYIFRKKTITGMGKELCPYNMM